MKKLQSKKDLFESWISKGVGNQDYLLGPKEQETSSTISNSTDQQNYLVIQPQKAEKKSSTILCLRWNLNTDMKPTMLLPVSS